MKTIQDVLSSIQTRLDKNWPTGGASVRLDGTKVVIEGITTQASTFSSSVPHTVVYDLISCREIYGRIAGFITVEENILLTNLVKSL